MQRAWITSLIVASVMAWSVAAGANDKVTTESLQAAFRWFDGLGYPRVGDLPFVCVWDGTSDKDARGRVVAHAIHGFLVARRGERFTVFFPNLTQKTYVQNHLLAASPKRIEFENVDIETWARGWIAGTKSLGAVKKWDDPFDGRINEAAQIFVLARACAGHRLDSLALKLVKVQQNSGVGLGGESDWSYQKKLREHVAEVFMWDTILRFDKPRVGRDELLAAFRDISVRFGDSAFGPRAREATEVLDRMVREDRDHSAVAKPIQTLHGKERIAELIFELRDQNGQQISQPGSCDIFMDERDKDSPAQQLVDIGFEAIPQLIEVLDDRRFTRSIAYWRSFAFSHTVMRVGDAARKIIERIAHREFDTGTGRRDTFVEFGNASAMKKRIAAWWRDYKVRGEKARTARQRGAIRH